MEIEKVWENVWDVIELYKKMFEGKTNKNFYKR